MNTNYITEFIRSCVEYYWWTGDYILCTKVGPGIQFTAAIVIATYHTVYVCIHIFPYS